MRPLKSIYLAISVIALIAIGCFLFFRPGMEGDTQALVDGSLKAFQCVREGRWGRCEDAAPFTVFQYIPAWMMELFGAGKGPVIHMLAYLSMITGILSFREMYRTLKKTGSELAWLGILLLATGFWIRYINLSSNEMLASFMILMAVIGVLDRRSLGSTAFYFWGATLTKDMACVFLLFWLAVTVLFVPQAGLRWGRALKLGLAVFAGVLCNTAFNLFRYSTIVNRGYLSPQFLVHDPRLQTSFFFAQWFSPSGGLWIFWTSFCLLMLAAAWITHRQNGFRKKIPALSIFFIFGALTLGFSKWYSPLGGGCWGDRFFLPWIPGLSLFLLWTYPNEFKALLRRWTSHGIAFWGGSLFLAILAFPQFQFLTRQSLIGRVLFPAACGGLRDYAYENCVFWQPWPWGIVSFYAPFPRPDLFLLSALLSSWVIAICLQIRSNAAR